MIKQPRLLSARYKLGMASNGAPEPTEELACTISRMRSNGSRGRSSQRHTGSTLEGLPADRAPRGPLYVMALCFTGQTACPRHERSHTRAKRVSTYKGR